MYQYQCSHRRRTGRGRYRYIPLLVQVQDAVAMAGPRPGGTVQCCAGRYFCAVNMVNMDKRPRAPDVMTSTTPSTRRPNGPCRLSSGLPREAGAPPDAWPNSVASRAQRSSHLLPGYQEATRTPQLSDRRGVLQAECCVDAGTSTYWYRPTDSSPAPALRRMRTYPTAFSSLVAPIQPARVRGVQRGSLSVREQTDIPSC